MRSITTVVLAVAISSVSLTGCGQYAAPGALQSGQFNASGYTFRSQHVQEFAQILEEQGYKHVKAKGYKVVVTTEGVETTYDFSRTAKTGQVRITAQGFTTEVSYEELVAMTEQGATDILPAMLVPIAIQVGVGGAIKLAHYAITHRGDKFKKEEAIKATVEGMLLALVPVVRDVKYAQFLVPLAVALVSRAKTLHYKDLAHAAMEMRNQIVEVIWQMLKAGKITLRQSKA